jgi:hypothetical protein
MSLLTYTDLVQACQDWLFGRADIAPRVPDFIRLFEGKANRNLLCRQMENRCVTTIDINVSEPEFLLLPVDFQSMRRVRLLNAFSGGTGAIPAKPRLKFATGAQLDDIRALNPNPGPPVWFGIFGNEMELVPTPDNNYPVEIVYRMYLPPLATAPEGTNWLFSFAPDAYLYGTLMEAAPYLHDDDRIPVWQAGAAAAISELNSLSEEASYNAGPLTIRRTRRGYS